MGKSSSSPPPQPTAGQNYGSWIKSYAQNAGLRRGAEKGDLETQISLAGMLIPALMELTDQYGEAAGRQDMAIERALGPEYADTQRLLQGLEIENIAELGPLMKAAVTDPQTEAIRERLGRQVGDDLALGSKLNLDQAREIEQGVRAGQTARGVSRGTGAISAEALMKGVRAEQLLRNRQAAASRFLQTQSQTGFDPLRALTGRASTQQQFNAGAAMPSNFQGVAAMTPMAMAQDQRTNLINSQNAWNASQSAKMGQAQAKSSWMSTLLGDSMNLTGMKTGQQNYFMR